MANQFRKSCKVVDGKSETPSCAEVVRHPRQAVSEAFIGNGGKSTNKATVTTTVGVPKAAEVDPRGGANPTKRDDLSNDSGFNLPTRQGKAQPDAIQAGEFEYNKLSMTQKCLHYTDLTPKQRNNVRSHFSHQERYEKQVRMNNRAKDKRRTLAKNSGRVRSRAEVMNKLNADGTESNPGPFVIHRISPSAKAKLVERVDCMKAIENRSHPFSHCGQNCFVAISVVCMNACSTKKHGHRPCCSQRWTVNATLAIPRQNGTVDQVVATRGAYVCQVKHDLSLPKELKRPLLAPKPITASDEIDLNSPPIISRGPSPIVGPMLAERDDTTALFAPNPVTLYGGSNAAEKKPERFTDPNAQPLTQIADPQPTAPRFEDFFNDYHPPALDPGSPNSIGDFFAGIDGPETAGHTRPVSPESQPEEAPDTPPPFPKFLEFTTRLLNRRWRRLAGEPPVPPPLPPLPHFHNGVFPVNRSSGRLARLTSFLTRRPNSVRVITRRDRLPLPTSPVRHPDPISPHLNGPCGPNGPVAPRMPFPTGFNDMLPIQAGRYAVSGPTFFKPQTSRRLPEFFRCSSFEKTCTVTVNPPLLDTRPSMITNATLRTYNSAVADVRLEGDNMPSPNINFVIDKYRATEVCDPVLKAIVPCAVGLPLALLSPLVPAYHAVHYLVDEYLALERVRTYDVVPDWLTSIMMTSSNPDEIRTNGLRRIALSASLNVESSQYMSLAQDTVDLAQLASEQGFQLAPGRARGSFL